MADQLMFDDLPSFDDIPESQGSPTQGGPLMFDDLPSFDQMPDDALPAPEGPIKRGVRNIANAVIPTVTGFVGAGAGTILGTAGGALTAPVTGPVGPVAGGIAGAVAGGMAGGYAGEVAQHAVKDWVGLNDDKQMEANRRAHPTESAIEGMIPAVAAMRFDKAATLTARAVSGGLMGGVDAAQQAYQKGEVDPLQTAAAVGMGVAFPTPNKVGGALIGTGEKIGKFVPGRPGKASNPEAAQAKADVGDSTEIDAAASALAEPVQPRTGDTTGNPQSAPERSERNYGKDKPTEATGEGSTSGDISPDIAAAVKDPNSPPIAEMPPDPLERKGNLKWQDLPPNDPRGQSPQEPIPPDAAALGTHEGPGYKPQAEPVVDTGFPQPGEPVAMGANDAAPMPPEMPAKAAAAIAKSRAATPSPSDRAQLKLKLQAAGEKVPLVAEKAMPEIKGEPHPSPTEGQAAAGNYLKGRTHDFGKPQKIETSAGGTRRGKNPDGTDWEHTSPYDYGYFNKTKGADKDHIDFARPTEGSPEQGDKHFIIDQKNAETGKFDEHKVFTYYKDEAAARDHYLKGFGDGKGEQRLGAITEVDRPGLVKWLQKHTNRAANKPFGDFKSEPVTAAVTEGGWQRPANDKLGIMKQPGQRAKIGEPKVVTEARRLMQERGLPPDAIQRFSELEPGVRAAEATKYVNATRSKTGVVKSAEDIRIRGKAPEVPGTEGITARDKADAERKGNALATMKKAVEDHPPVEGEDHAALRARLEKIVEAGGQAIKDYKPAEKPAAFQVIREAKKMLQRKKWTDAHVTAFNAEEKLQRNGGAADSRATNRIEADIARSRRSGDDAVANAEKNIDNGRNTVEDEMLAAIDAKRAKGDMDFHTVDPETVPGIERPIKTKADLPKKAKTINAEDSELAKIDTKPLEAEAKRKLEAARIQADLKRQQALKESEGAASKGKEGIKVVDPEELARINAMLDKAAARGKLAASEAQARKSAPKAPAEESAAARLKREADRFLGDTSGAVDFAQMAKDIKDAFKLGPRTKHASYISKTSKLPDSEYTRGVSESFHKMTQADKSHEIWAQKKAQEVADELSPMRSKLDRLRRKNFGGGEMMKKIYFAREEGKLSTLTPEETAFYDKHMKPVLDEIDQFLAAGRALDPERFGPEVADWVHRIPLMESKQNKFFRNGEDDPTRPEVHINAITTSANAAKVRKFVALERVSDGQRFVISPDEGGNAYTLWKNHKATRVRDPGFEFEAGKPHTIGGNDYIMRDAFTREIERHANNDKGEHMRYYHNAMASALIAHVQLGSMVRHLAEVHRLTNTPEFAKLSAAEGSAKAKEHPDWEPSKLKNAGFAGKVFDPQLRYVLDDYARPGFNTPDGLRNFAQGVTKLLFWSPTAHAANVGVHWAVGRGWDWFTPRGYWRLGKTLPKAIKSVITQDHLQTQLADEGAGTILRGVLARDWNEKVMTNLGEEMKQKPGKWGPIADKLGLTTSQLFNGIYNNSSKVMWAANDVFITQRVLELMDKHPGMTRKEAIIETERDIPNYRLPTTIISEGKLGRFYQKMQADPAVFSFGRYHYAVFNSLANVLKDGFGKNATLADRVDAAGKIMALTVIGMYIYPKWDEAIKWITGNKDATAQRRGPMALVNHLKEAGEGNADIMKWARSTTSVPSYAGTALETLYNRDWRGKPIVEPDTVRAAVHGSLPAAGQVLGQIGDHTAKGLISPYSTYANARAKGQGPLTAIRDSLLDVSDPSAKGAAYKKKLPQINERQARARFKRGGEGPMEALMNKIGGYR